MGNEQKGKGVPAPKMPTANEIKTYIMIIQNKLTLFRNKKIASIKQKKKEIAKYLKENNLDVAKAKMDTIIREEDMITVYDILGPLCEILKERVTYIISNTECPPDLRAQLDSILYAATRMEIEELHTLRDMIMRRYGQAYIMKAESNADKLVNVNLVEKLRIKPASDVFVTIRLKQLCKEQKIPFEFPMEVENDIPIDPMNPQNPYGGGNMNPFDNPQNNNPFGPPQDMNNNMNNNPYGPPQDMNNNMNNNPYGPPQNMNNNMNNNPYGPPSGNNNQFGPPPDNNNPYGPPSGNNNPYGPPSGNNNQFGPPPDNNNPYGPPSNNSNPFGPPSDNKNPYGPQSDNNNPYGPPQDANPFDQNNKPLDQNSNIQFDGMSQDNNDNLDCKYTSLRNKPPKKGEKSKDEKNENMSQLSQSKESDNKIPQESPSSGMQNNNNDNPFAGETNGNPYSKDANKSDNPFGGEESKNDNPYGGDNNKNDNPFGGEGNKNDNPYGGDNNNKENPFGGETNDNPYGGDSNKNENPFGGETNDNPYGGDSNKNDNPFGGESNKNDNPLGGDSDKHDNPFLQDNSNPFGNSMTDSIVNPYAQDTNENKDNDFPKP